MKKVFIAGSRQISLRENPQDDVLSHKAMSDTTKASSFMLCLIYFIAYIKLNLDYFLISDQ